MSHRPAKAVLDTARRPVLCKHVHSFTVSQNVKKAAILEKKMEAVKAVYVLKVNNLTVLYRSLYFPATMWPTTSYKEIHEYTLLV